MKIRILIPRIHLKNRHTWRLLLMPAFRSSHQESQGQAGQPEEASGQTLGSLRDPGSVNTVERTGGRHLTPTSGFHNTPTRAPAHKCANTHADMHRPHIQKQIHEPKSQRMHNKASKFHHTKQLLKSGFVFVKQVGNSYSKWITHETFSLATSSFKE